MYADRERAVVKDVIKDRKDTKTEKILDAKMDISYNLTKELHYNYS